MTSGSTDTPSTRRTTSEICAQGPVIRLNPDELHFINPDYYDDLFNIVNGRTEKSYRVANAFGPYAAAIGTVDHELHRTRRSALNPFFSKKSVNELVPSIVPIIDALCDRLARASKSSEPIDLKYCFPAVTLDIINEYCFSTNPNTILKPDFGRQGFDDIDSFLEISLVNVHVPWLMRSLYSLPDWLMRKINPAMSDALDFRASLAKQLEDIRQQKDLSHLKSAHRTIFHELLQSKLPPAEMRRDRLRDEAFSLVNAGSGTSAYVIKNLSYHIAANHHVQQKLLRELKDVMFEPNSQCALQVLEHLPYLNAVVKEGLRLTPPVAHRISRSFPDKVVTYNNQDVPPGTVVHMTALLTHENEDIFLDLKVFNLEKWIGDEKLQRYLVPFARGTRACLGINLAWAELYLIIDKIFRRFDFDVSEVVRERDIDVAKDVLMGVPRSDTKGIIVKVLENES